MKKDITELFYYIANFTEGLEKEIKKQQLSSKKATKLPTRKPSLDISEITTIILMFQESP